ncbi:MAG: hypothetical protein ITD49_00055 [Candidatus Nitrotoga sp.]|jgi:hypothetical protein|nr:hypothetical protein [Candidatus Nitrotoga sp.]
MNAIKAKTQNLFDRYQDKHGRAAENRIRTFPAPVLIFMATPSDSLI